TVLPEYPVMQYTNEKKIEALKLVVYFDESEHHSYGYTDHGDTFAFEQNIYLERHFVQIGASTSLTVLQQREGLFTERYDDYKLYFVGLPFQPNQAIVDGIQVQLLDDPETNEKYIVVDNDFKKLVLQ